jgi:heptaprenyl diphosphate synthase
MKSASNNSKKTLNLISFLSALCLFLSLIEYIIPKPIPFMRMGLANFPILIGLYLLTPQMVFLLILIKVLGQALIQGTLLSYVFLFSFCGSFASGIAMVLLSIVFKKNISLLGLSVFGALASNAMQILLAVYFVFGDSGWIIASPILIIGFISSIILGLFAQTFFEKSIWIKKVLKAD